MAVLSCLTRGKERGAEAAGAYVIGRCKGDKLLLALSLGFSTPGQYRTHWLRRTSQRPDTTNKTGIKTAGTRIH